jgi:hypothetical protein
VIKSEIGVEADAVEQGLEFVADDDVAEGEHGVDRIFGRAARAGGELPGRRDGKKQTTNSKWQGEVFGFLLFAFCELLFKRWETKLSKNGAQQELLLSFRLLV